MKLKRHVLVEESLYTIVCLFCAIPSSTAIKSLKMLPDQTDASPARERDTAQQTTIVQLLVLE